METSMNERSINPELDEALGRVDDEQRFPCLGRRPDRMAVL